MPCQGCEWLTNHQHYADLACAKMLAYLAGCLLMRECDVRAGRARRELFVQMQVGPRRRADVTALAKALELDHSVQQACPASTTMLAG